MAFYLFYYIFDSGYYRDNLSSLNQNSVESKTFFIVVVDPLNNGRETQDSFKLW